MCRAQDLGPEPPPVEVGGEGGGGVEKEEVTVLTSFKGPPLFLRSLRRRRAGSEPLLGPDTPKEWTDSVESLRRSDYVRKDVETPVRNIVTEGTLERYLTGVPH